MQTSQGEKQTHLLCDDIILTGGVGTTKIKQLGHGAWI